MIAVPIVHTHRDKMGGGKRDLLKEGGGKQKRNKKKKKTPFLTGKFLSGTENMKFWILVFFSFFFFLFFLRGLSCGFWWVSL